MKDISSIVNQALSQGRACILETQATEAAVLFGVDLLRDEVDPPRQVEIQTALADALSETAPGSHARTFMNELLTTVEATWANTRTP